MNTRAILLGMTLLALGGCATVSPPLHDAAYAPTAPAADTAAPVNNGSIYQGSRSIALFEDVKARNVGDLLTIDLVENTNASKSASTETSKSQNIDMGGPTLFGRPVLSNGKEILEVQVGADRDFSGEGGSAQSNQLSGRVTVTVADVLPNGNLVVRGEKVLTLNQGDEFIRFSGIVRPADINADNTVLSTKVADARIIYGGRGVISEANQMGWLGRFFQSVIWPF